MDKNIVKIFILGFLWVLVGIGVNLYKKEEGAGTITLAIGLCIESVALLLFCWKKIQKK